MNATRLLFIYTAVLLLALLLVLWLLDYSSLGIPERIPGTQWPLYTIAIFVVMILVLIIFQRHLVKTNPGISVGKLILYGFIVCVVAQAIYQLFRQFWELRNENNNKGKEYLISMAAIAVFSLFFSSSVGVEMKKANALIRYGSLVIIVGLVYLLKENFDKITW
jgi:hypothetical protein